MIGITIELVSRQKTNHSGPTIGYSFQNAPTFIPLRDLHVLLVNASTSIWKILSMPN